MKKKQSAHSIQPIVKAMILLAWLISSCLWVSCTNDNDYSGGSQEADSVRTVIVRLELPTGGIQRTAPSHYTLSATDETTVQTLDVLVFRIDNQDPTKEYFAYSAPSIELIQDNGSSKTYKVSLLEYDFQQRLVFIANAREQLTALGSIPNGAEKQGLLKRLQVNMQAQWPAESPSNFTSFPMWGEYSQGLIIQNNTAITEHVKLMRMVARIDVSVAQAVQSKFKLKEVYLYNYYQDGRIVPDTVNINKLSFQAIAATIPQEAMPTKGPLQYLVDNNTEIEGAIYLMENAEQVSPLLATCLVIGGVYGTDNQISYYRGDFGTTGQKFRSLLRNHEYDITIGNVLQTGHTTPEEAFISKWKNIECSVVDWDLALVDVTDQESYHLKVSQATFQYMKKGATTKQSLSIVTDYKKSESNQGWTATLEPVEASAWIQTENGTTAWSGAANNTFTINFDIPENQTGEDRHGWIKIKAGNLTKYIDIYQTNQVWIEGIPNTITDWTTTEPIDTNMDGPYRLGVSQTYYALTKKQEDGLKLNISTDYKKGYITRVESADQGTEWLTITANGSSTVPATSNLLFSVATNEHSYSRTAKIYVQAGNLVKVVKVEQLARISGTVEAGMEWTLSTQDATTDIDGPYKLGVSQTAYNFLKNEHPAVELLVTTDYKNGYKAVVTEGGAWITIKTNQSSTGAVTNQSITFDLKENNDYAKRSGKILIQAGNIKKYITVSQLSTSEEEVSAGMEWTFSTMDTTTDLDGPYKLGVSQTAYNLFKNEHPGVELLVTTDYKNGYKAVVTEGSTWITIKTNQSSTGTVTNQSITFDLKENNDYAKRSGKILIQAGNIKKYITVSQLFTSEEEVSAGMEWTLSTMDTTTDLDGPYKLGVSQTAYNFLKNEHPAVELLVTTDYKSGYKAVVTQGGTWITIKTNQSNEGTVTNQRITFDLKENNDYAQRSGKILIQAGNIKKYITVSQLSASEEEVNAGAEWAEGNNGNAAGETELDGAYTLSLSKSTFQFAGDALSTTLNVTANGAGTWAASTAQGWITITTPSGSANGTTTLLTFALTAYPQGEAPTPRIGTIVVRLSSGGNKIVKYITIRQYAGGVVEAELTGMYQTDKLAKQYFILKTQMDWSVVIASDPSGIIQTIQTTGGKANVEGEKVYFSLKTIGSGGPYTATLQVVSPTGEFLPYPVTITAQP